MRKEKSRMSTSEVWPLNREIGIDLYTLTYIKQILIIRTYCIEVYSVFSNDLYGKRT